MDVLNLNKNVILSGTIIFIKYFFFITIGAIITSYYILYLLIMIRKLCFYIYGENTYSFQNYVLYVSLLILGYFLLKKFYNYLMPDTVAVDASLFLLGPIIAVYTVYVKDAHINRFVINFLKKWKNTHKKDKLDAIKIIK